MGSRRPLRCLFLKRRALQYYDELARGLEENGIQALGLFNDNREDLDRIRRAVERFRPGVLLTIPSLSLPISDLSASLDIPYIHWEVDKLLDEGVLAHAFSPHLHLFTPYLGDVPLFRNAGIRAHYGLNVCNIDPTPDHAAIPLRHEVTFVGSVEAGRNNPYRELLALNDRQAAGWPEPLPRLWEVVKGRLEDMVDILVQGSLEFQNWLPQLLAEEFRDNPGLYRPLGLTPADLTVPLAKETAHRQRAHFLRVVPCLDAYGPEDWQRVLPHWPNVRYHRPVEQYGESGRVFAASRINLSLSRIYARDGLSDRIFNILFAGGFLLADRQPPLVELFTDGEELATYASPGELAEKSAWYRAHEMERQRIARRGQERVRREHTFGRRLAQMLDLVFS
ncbi:MAG: glycosyltransferase family 1 protein [Magnetococcales bacterium]|nr:glycosyltransferase family 1 protein [Magnetococcales bacterium]